MESEKLLTTVTKSEQQLRSQLDSLKRENADVRSFSPSSQRHRMADNASILQLEAELREAREAGSKYSKVASDLRTEMQDFHDTKERAKELQEQLSLLRDKVPLPLLHPFLRSLVSILMRSFACLTEQRVLWRPGRECGASCEGRDPPLGRLSQSLTCTSADLFLALVRSKS